MKAKLFIILFLLTLNILFAQAQPGNPSKYTKITTEPTANLTTKYFELYDWTNTQTPRIYIIPYSKLAEWFGISGDQTITDNWNFEDGVILGALSSTTDENKLFINSSTGKLALLKNGSIVNYVTTEDLTPYSLGDTVHFVHDNANATLSATYTLSGILDAKTGIVYMPYETTAQSDSLSGNFRIYFNQADSMVYINAKDGANDKFLAKLPSLAWLMAQDFYNISGTYITTNSTQSSLYGNKTFSSGTITPWIISFGSVDAGRSLILPKDKNRVVSTSSGSVFVDDNDNNRLVIYDKSGVETPYMRVSDTQDEIALTLNSIAPTDLTGDDATLDWTDKNYNQAKCGGSEQPITITVENYTSGWISFSIDNQGDDVTISISGVTIKYPYGTAPDFSDGKLHKVNLEYYSSTVCLLTEVTFD